MATFLNLTAANLAGAAVSTAVTAVTPATGSALVKHSAFAAQATPVVATGGTVRCAASGGGTAVAFYEPDAPGSADQCYRMGLKFLTSIGGNELCGTLLRYDTAADTGYFLGARGNDTFCIEKRVSGVVTSLKSYPYYEGYPSPAGINATHHIVAEVSGSTTTTLNLYVDGILRCTVTDPSSPITAAGRAGALMQASNTVSDTTGIHIRYLLAYDPPSYDSVAMNNAALYYPGGAWDVSAGAAITPCENNYFKFQSDLAYVAVDIDLSQYVTSGLSSFDYPTINYTVTGIPLIQNPNVVPVGTTRIVLYNGEPGTMREFRVTVKVLSVAYGRYNLPLVSVAKFTGMKLSPGGSLTATTPLPDLIWVVGDSLTANIGGGVPWHDYLALGFGCERTCIGYSGNGWDRPGQGSAPNTMTSFSNIYSGKARDFTVKPKHLVFLSGYNDGATAIADATTIATVKAGLTTARAAMGASTWIWLAVPLQGVKRSALTSAMSQYQAATPDGRTVLIDESALLSLPGMPADFAAVGAGVSNQYTIDGLHWNSGGNPYVGAYLLAAIRRSFDSLSIGVQNVKAGVALPDGSSGTSSGGGSNLRQDSPTSLSR